MPERLERLTLLQTKMGHTGIVDGQFFILLSVSRPVYLFLPIDERALETFEEFGIPAWMQEFVPTGKNIFTDDPIMKETKSGYLVFAHCRPLAGSQGRFGRGAGSGASDCSPFVYPELLSRRASLIQSSNRSVAKN